MAVRLAVEAGAGIVASNPEETIQFLADVAAADGADRDEWLAKAIEGAAHVEVAGEPRYAIVEDAVHRSNLVFDLAMQNVQRELVALLSGDSG